MRIKTTLAAALMAVGFVCQASAANVVYLTGSTAMRSTVYNQLNTPGAIFDSGATITRATRKFSGSNPNGASYMLFLGTISGTPTYINCVWSGSEAGIASAANVTLDNDGQPLAGSPATWLKADGSVAMTDATSAPAAGELETFSHGADLATADTSQAVSWTPYVANTSTALKDYGSMGIVTFTWVKNVNTAPNAAWTNLKSITTYQMQALFSSPQHAALFTGVSTDTNYVYLVGRNKGSGTRANALADSGFGISTAVNQFSVGGGVSTPATNLLVLASELNNGFESGGSVATALSVDGSCAQVDPFYGYPGWLAVGYLSTGDAQKGGLTVTNNWLSENGVAESNGTVMDGQYSFWGNEHLLGKQNIGGYQDAVGSKLFNAIKNTLNATAPNPANHDGAIGTRWMNASKVSDTAYPTHN